jgi:predicted HicB family RNase H-like nuclease
MTVLKYRDFQGSVSFEDGRLFIQILHIDDLIAADCDSASKVEQTFRELVDDYLETCAATGKEPKPFRGSFNVRIDPNLHKEAAMLAASEHVPLNAWVESAMRERLNCGAAVDAAHRPNAASAPGRATQPPKVPIFRAIPRVSRPPDV